MKSDEIFMNEETKIINKYKKRGNGSSIFLCGGAF